VCLTHSPSPRGPPLWRRRTPNRLVYLEALPDERDATSAGFLYRAVTWFRGHSVTVLRVLTDNAKVYRAGRNWRAVCVALGLRRRFTKPGCPWTNGKAERFNRTLQNEFAYAPPWLSHPDRLAALPDWLTHYNTRRAHSRSTTDPRSPDSPHDRQQRPGSVHLAEPEPGDVFRCRGALDVPAAGGVVAADHGPQPVLGQRGGAPGAQLQGRLQ
jgi:hypothetical protein